MPKAECPYGASDCPKTTSIDYELSEVRKALVNLTRIVYIACGFMICEFGVALW